MPNWEALEKLWKQIFGNQIAFWLLTVLGTVATIWLLLWLVAQIVELLKNTFWPIFYNKEEKQRNDQRRLFAKHLEDEVKNQGGNWEGEERNWDDNRFTELEAEVEAGGRHFMPSIIPFIKREYDGLKREKSLSNALRSSKETLILLEGDPGSGKSVALRHVALDLLNKARKSRSNSTILTVYINLRDLKRSENQPIDRELILNYVLFSLNPKNDQNARMFLDNEFQRGLRDGTWLFLFDSFDEIPDVLSSREVNSANSIVRKYADAISDFLHGMNQCRGIVASRYFHGPGHVDWTRFNIMALKVERQIQLIKRAEINVEQKQILIGHLASARPEIQTMITNPLFLSMVIRHVGSGKEFPEDSFTVFKSYADDRFYVRDKKRLLETFGLESQEVRNTAEAIAFCMTADSNLGLNPHRDEIKKAFERLRIPAIFELDKFFDALDAINIGYPASFAAVGVPKSFAFSHRRFQEYFATCFVLREHDQVSPSQLLTDAKWRETAVVLCQTQPEADLQNIIFEAGEDLYEYALEIEKWRQSNNEKGEVPPIPLQWPSGLLYLLDLLQDGFGHKRHVLPEYIRDNAGFILNIAQSWGILPDKKWSLEVGGIAPQPILLDALRNAIKHRSLWLNGVAYQQVSKLEEMPEDIAKWIRRLLLEKAGSFQLFRERFTTQAFLSRLSDKRKFLTFLRLLLILPILDLILNIAFIILFVVGVSKNINLPLDPMSIISSVPFLLLIPIMLVTVLILTPILLFPAYFTMVADSPMYMVTRLMTPLLAFVFVHGPMSQILVIFGGYLLFATPSAIVLLNEGVDWKNDLELFVAPIRVVVLGLTRIEQKIRNIISALFHKEDRNDSIKKSSIVLFGLIIFGVIFGMIIVLEPYATQIGMVLGIIYLIFGWPLMISSLVRHIRQNKIKKKPEENYDRKDRLMYKAWKQNHPQKLTGDEFLGLFFEYKTDYLYNFVESVVKNDILEKNKSGGHALALVIQYIEANAERGKHTQLIDDMCILLERIQSAKEN